MQVKPLGTTGLSVSSLALGTVALTSWGGHTRASASKVIRYALDAGFTAIDTAPAYGSGEAEDAVGQALDGRHDEVVLATKFGGPRPSGGREPSWPDGIPGTLEGSLRRLRTDHVDLYQMHDPHPDWNLDDVLGVLDRLVDQGKVRAIGTTRFPPEDIVTARWAATRTDTRPFSTEQPPYSILARDAERGVFDVCRSHGMGVWTHAPLNGGWLTGQYRSGREAPAASRARTWPARPDRFDFTRPAIQAKLAAVEQLAALAADSQLSLTTMAIAFAGSHPDVDSVITGPRTTDHVDTTAAAADVVLSDDVLARIDEIVTPGTTIDPLDALTYLAKARQRRHSIQEAGHHD